jgi:hypothetical protein
MLATIVGTTIIALVYICLAIIVFSPTIFAGWFFVVSRRLSREKAGVPKLLLATFTINVIVVFLLGRVAFDHFVIKSVYENDAQVEITMRNAVQSQVEFHARHGRYYAVGPVRGPFRNEHGLEVPKDVILQMRPRWEDVTSRDDSFEACAVHVLGRDAYFNGKDGEIHKAPDASERARAIRSKLVRSVR